VDYVLSSGPEPTPPPTAAPTPPPTTPPTPTPEPDLTVGDYRCLAYSDAEAQLLNDGFTLGTVTTPAGMQPTWPVGEQDPAPGSTAQAGDRIDLVVYDPASLATCPP
jgi:beta-lactam-binding protein with PASTA domain